MPLPLPIILALISLAPVVIENLPKILAALGDLWDTLTDDQKEALEHLQAMSDDDKEAVVRQAALMLGSGDTRLA